MLKKDFKAFREANTKEMAELRARFLRENKNFAKTMFSKGVFLEYDRERDHLYIAFGGRRDAMALFTKSVVILVDPDTVEAVGLEFSDFRQRIESGALKDMKGLADLVEEHPTLYIPSGEQQHWAEKELEREMAAV